MAKQNYLVDFYQPLVTGDTGEDNVDAIQPVSDGEPGTATVFRRPSENLRERTELTRDFAREMAYYRDFNHLGLWGSGSFKWGGTIALGGTGLLTVESGAGTVEVRPILTPGTNKKGSLVVGTAPNTITYALTATAYITEGFDLITVEHRDSAGSAITVTVTPGPVRRLLVVFDSTNVSHTVTAIAAAVTGVIAGDAQLNGNLTATPGAGTGVSVVFPETFIPGTADEEAHVVQIGDLSAMSLADGDAVAIRYDYLIENPPSIIPGGRWQSNPARGSAAIPGSALFKTTDNPEWIPGAVPLFKVYNNELVWVDGTRFPVGIPVTLGAVSATTVVVDDTVFTGPDTIITNGGIDNPLPTATVQDALNSVDARLAQRRAYTYVITDGVASTGGNFDSSTAVQDSISALSATGGTIFIRRGTYVIPNTYGIPANVTLVGEGTNLVTLAPATPAGLVIGPDVVLQNLSINVGTVEIAVSGNRAVLNNVALSGRVNFSGSWCITNNLSVSCVTDANYTLRVSGAFNTLIDTRVTGTVSVVGAHNNLYNSYVVNGIAVPATNILFNLGGVKNNVDSLAIGSTVAISGCAYVLVVGTECQLSRPTISAAGGATSCVGLSIAPATGINVSNATVQMVTGTPLLILGGSTGVIKNSRFSNNSSSALDRVISFLAGGTQSRISFNDCTFDQLEQVGHALFDLAVISFPTITASYFDFTDCKFTAARNAGFATRAINCQFTRCEFEIKNPIDFGLGVRLLGGAADSQTNALFQFLSGCVLKDCVINGNDSEIRVIAGQPLIDVPLYAQFDLGADVHNLSLFNVNRHLRTVVGSGVGLIHLQNALVGSTGATFPRTQLDGLKIFFTPTAPVQAGTPYLGNYITLSGNHISVNDFTSPDTSLVTSNTSPFGQYVSFNLNYITLSNIMHLAEYYAPLVFDPATPIFDISFKKCVFGREIAPSLGCTEANGIPVPVGQRIKFEEVTFVGHTTDSTAGGFELGASAIDYIFDRIYLYVPIPVDNSRGVFNGSTTYSRFRFLGCTFAFTATGALTKPFAGAGCVFNSAGSFTCLGAGNTWYYTTGTPGAPTFAANINTW